MRNPYFDNAKAILIALVVAGHIIQPFIETNYIVKIVFTFIYTFHMPAITLLSGYFSKYIRNYSKAELKYLGLFLIFTLIYYPFSNTDIITMYLVPQRVLWYLVSLASWYIMLQFFIKFKHPIILAFAIAITVGYIPYINTFISLSRTFILFPFFIIGYYMQLEDFEKIKSHNRIIAFSIMIFTFIYLWFADINYIWTNHCLSYEALGIDNWYACIYRIIFLIFIAIVTYCFFVIVSKKPNKFTHIGEYTLPIFFIHDLILLIFFS